MKDDDKLLIRKIYDLVCSSEKSFCVVYSRFLTPAEQTIISKEADLSGYVSFDGGYENAERRLCRVCTSEYNSDDGVPIEAFRAVIKGRNGQISHRDVLGSLMGLGITREMIGDINVRDNTGVFFCHKLSSDYIEQNLTKIGRYSVVLSKTDVTKEFVIRKEPFVINVSSMRLDCIAAECFGMSRTKAAEAVRKEEVTVNWLVASNPAREMKPGDKLAMRGRGKAEISEISGTSRKGRLFVNCLRFV